MSLETLLTGYRRFKERFEQERETFLRLAEEGQSPLALWIGCSDSRVTPELITGAVPGELFVVRNTANIVPPFGVAGGEGVGATVEYAVLHLRVPQVIVCGHTGCGGIKALEEHVSMAHEPYFARWIELARPAHAHVEAAGVPEEARYLETVKANVLLQRENLRTYACIREAVKVGRLTLHAWLYDLHTGDLSAYDDATGRWQPLPPTSPPVN